MAWTKPEFTVVAVTLEVTAYAGKKYPLAGCWRGLVAPPLFPGIQLGLATIRV